MQNNLLKKTTNREFVSGKLALVFLLLFQLMFYLAVVEQNESNLLPIRHVIKINTFEEKTPEAGNVTLSRYQTDSVEIVKGHFFDFNITVQLLLLSLFEIIFFRVFRKMKIYPTPFLIPLFIILTVSIFYHNYLGHRIIDRFSVPVEQILCNGNCDSEEKYITAKTKEKEGEKAKEFKIDKHKLGEIVNEAAKIYPVDRRTKITLDSQKDPTSEESAVNKYKRASADSKNHFKWICFGLAAFITSMIFAKFFSKVKNFSDKKFQILTVLSLIICIAGFCFAKWTSLPVTTILVEILKLVAILLTVVGYEKINKNKKNFVLYFVTLLCETGLLFFLDLGNAIILGIIVILVLFLTFPLKKKYYLVLIPFFVAVPLIIGIFFVNIENYKPNENNDNMWRLFDTFDGLTQPQYYCEKTEKDKTTKFFSFSNENGHCRQVNTDNRLAMFAVLKDGLQGGGHSGFKENTFLLNNNYMYTDFVFCGLIAFFGIWLAIMVVFCIGVLIWNCNIQPKECGNNYKHFLYSNIMVVILGVQTLIHIGGNLNVIPFTGVILPFLSKGGASTIVVFATLGFALSGLVSDDFYDDSMSVFRKIKSRFQQFINKLTDK